MWNVIARPCSHFTTIETHSSLTPRNRASLVAMPGRRGLSAKVKGEQGVPPAGPGGAAAASLQPESDVGAVNADHYAKIQEALSIIEQAPGMQDIRTAAPLPLDEGGTIAPFDSDELKKKLTRGESYICGCTLYFANPLRDASPGVPLDSMKISAYMAHNFADIDSIVRLPAISICCDADGGT